MGSYANLVRTSVDRSHIIPASMSYKEAATLPFVYLCSLCALYHLANLREGQSVLMHLATGDVGIAYLELARYKKAEVCVFYLIPRSFMYSLAAVKRWAENLTNNKSCIELRHCWHRGKTPVSREPLWHPPKPMFSSRSNKFAKGISEITGGRGVDVVVDSLIEELLMRPGELRSTVASQLDLRWTPISESMLQKVLSYSIMQQDATKPIYKDSSTQMVTGIAYPLPQDGSDMTREPRLSYLYNSHGGSRAGGLDEASGDMGHQHQALQAFVMLHRSGADVLPGHIHIAKILRLENEVDH
ncbi:hypothetical protein F4821DRAFT_280707 [Hypoxylon rubiginosum]|uniref:Uncharacterized protein n=1 Tax=Hypoxylon rubiginosum TaxID=110542 RepID=A0ACC0DFL4_9PEZI|nr:hypothetical protein F4821DRAFT_280707 [Hypoxylon rubiginosum]